MSTLVGIWKISAHLRRGTAATLPRHVKFEIGSAISAPAIESGTVEIPYAAHCGGHWEVHAGSEETDDIEASTSRASFVVECAARQDVGASGYRFDGLYDGERIAGTVSDRSGDEVADFLCTRLYTFWGAPKVAADTGPDR